MAKPFNIYEAKTRLSELVERAERGEEIVIAKSGRPVARLLPFQTTRKRRQPGRGRGRIKISADFDAPLPADILRDFGVED